MIPYEPEAFSKFVTLHDLFISNDSVKQEKFELILLESNQYRDLIQNTLIMLAEDRVGYPWRKREIDYLKGMFFENISLHEISVRLRRSQNSIENKLIKLGLLPERY